MKHKMTFKLERSDATIKVTTGSVSLEDILSTFEDFLIGCGFQIKTDTLEINSEDDSEATDVDVDESLEEQYEDIATIMEDDLYKSGAV